VPVKGVSSQWSQRVAVKASAKSVLDFGDGM
jgi:hypothetical protein